VIGEAFGSVSDKNGIEVIWDAEADRLRKVDAEVYCTSTGTVEPGRKSDARRSRCLSWLF
jgi:hypothetical protein